MSCCSLHFNVRLRRGEDLDITFLVIPYAPPSLFTSIILKYRKFFSSSTIHLFPVLQQRRHLLMASSVLGVGIPATSSLTPVEMQPGLQKALDIMESDMAASPYDWEMFYFTPDMPFDLWVSKLREKKWDIVMVGSKSL